MGAQSDADLLRVREQHRSIARLIVDLGDKLSRIPDESGVATADAREIGERLAQLESELAAHFELEQLIGFVSAALDDAPRLGRRAVALAAEHEALRREIAHVRAEATRPNPSWVETREDFRTFAIDMQEHEEHENDLISEALLDDLGGGS